MAGTYSRVLLAAYTTQGKQQFGHVPPGLAATSEGLKTAAYAHSEKDPLLFDVNLYHHDGAVDDSINGTPLPLSVGMWNAGLYANDALVLARFTPRYIAGPFLMDDDLWEDDPSLSTPQPATGPNDLFVNDDDSLSDGSQVKDDPPLQEQRAAVEIHASLDTQLFTVEALASEDESPLGHNATCDATSRGKSSNNVKRRASKTFQVNQMVKKAKHQSHKEEMSMSHGRTQRPGQQDQPIASHEASTTLTTAQSISPAILQRRQDGHTVRTIDEGSRSIQERRMGVGSPSNGNKRVGAAVHRTITDEAYEEKNDIATAVETGRRSTRLQNKTAGIPVGFDPDREAEERESITLVMECFTPSSDGKSKERIGAIRQGDLRLLDPGTEIHEWIEKRTNDLSRSSKYLRWYEEQGKPQPRKNFSMLRSSASGLFTDEIDFDDRLTVKDYVRRTRAKDRTLKAIIRYSDCEVKGFLLPSTTIQDTDDDDVNEAGIISVEAGIDTPARGAQADALAPLDIATVSIERSDEATEASLPSTGLSLVNHPTPASQLQNSGPELHTLDTIDHVQGAPPNSVELEQVCITDGPPSSINADGSESQIMLGLLPPDGNQAPEDKDHNSLCENHPVDRTSSSELMLGNGPQSEGFVKERIVTEGAKEQAKEAAIKSEREYTNLREATKDQQPQVYHNARLPRRPAVECMVVLNCKQKTQDICGSLPFQPNTLLKLSSDTRISELKQQIASRLDVHKASEPFFRELPVEFDVFVGNKGEQYQVAPEDHEYLGTYMYKACLWEYRRLYCTVGLLLKKPDGTLYETVMHFPQWVEMFPPRTQEHRDSSQPINGSEAVDHPTPRPHSEYVYAGLLASSTVVSESVEDLPPKTLEGRADGVNYFIKSDVRHGRSAQAKNGSHRFGPSNNPDQIDNSSMIVHVHYEVMPRPSGGRKATKMQGTFVKEYSQSNRLAELKLTLKKDIQQHWARRYVDADRTLLPGLQPHFNFQLHKRLRGGEHDKVDFSSLPDSMNIGELYRNKNLGLNHWKDRLWVVAAFST